jgi:hypothetical protein
MNTMHAGKNRSITCVLVLAAANMAFSCQQNCFIPFLGCRSAIYSTMGMIACSQPLAVRAGQTFLANGGNAAVGTLYRVGSFIQ